MPASDDDLLECLGRIEALLKAFTAAFIKAEGEIPEYLRRHTMYYHDLVHIKWAQEQIGQQMDPVQAAELERTHRRLNEVIEQETTQGGVFHPHIKRMAKEGKIRSNV